MKASTYTRICVAFILAAIFESWWRGTFSDSWQLLYGTGLVCILATEHFLLLEKQAEKLDTIISMLERDKV